MTSTFTILCPEGIVLAADSRITYQMYPGNDWKYLYRDDIQKVYPLEKTGMCLSYWGKQPTQDKTMLEHLIAVEDSMFKEEDNVSSVADKLADYFRGIEPPIEHNMGLHIAGFIEGSPALRHVFHESWNLAGEFENENCHEQYHIAPYGNTVSYRTRKKYPVLFNGDNLIAKALFRYAHLIEPYYDIVPDSLNLDHCVRLAKLIISTSISRLNYYFDQRMQQNKIPARVGGPVYIAEMSEGTIDLKKYDPDTLELLE